MDMRHSFIRLIAISAVAAAMASCVKTDFTLGNNVMPDNERFVTEWIDIPLDSIEMRLIDKLSGYSSLRINVGSIYDESNGVKKISRRGSAMFLIPVSSEVNWGKNQAFESFIVHTSLDTLSYENDSQRYIMQNIRAYDLRDLSSYDPDSTFFQNFRYTSDIRNKDFEGKTPVSQGTIAYGGSKNLTIPLNESFAKSYIGEGKETIDTASVYTRKHPGFYLCCDDPVSTGGRFNFFKVGLDYDSDSYYIKDCYAELKFKADYGTRSQVDTSVIFAIGADDFTESATYYAFNVCEEDYLGGAAPTGKAEKEVYIDGGTGLKPMIRAERLRNTILDSLASRGIYKDVQAAALSEKIILNRASLILPFDAPDYKEWKFFPDILNPTIRVTTNNGKNVSYAGITDASVSDEDQGNINYDISAYCPDITHHLQTILSTDPDKNAETLEKANIWLLALAQETFTVKTQSNSQADYYNQMAYLSYYNSMMGGYGYGGYGYGGYGYGGYDNYYNYYMMQSMYDSMYNNSNGTSTSTTAMLDKDRFYRCSLNGPKAIDKATPYLRLVYSYLKEE